ncbi:MAG: GspE/PulE family protein [Betaproteobacteria bacterium]
MTPSESSLAPAITPESLLRARARAVRELRPVPEVMCEDLGLTPEQCLQALAANLRWQVIDPGELATATPAFEVISFGESVTRQIFPCRNQDGALFLVLADPFSPGLVPWAEDRVRENFAWRLADETALSTILGTQDEARHTVSNLQLDDVEDGGEADDILVISLQSLAGDANPVVRLVNSTLFDALKEDVSDIHFECNATGLTVKYRIDGVLSEVTGVPSPEFATQLVSRLKIMSQLDISEHRVPQDGRFKALIGGRQVDFRVSIIPSLFGEDVVLRILDKKAVADEVSGLTLDRVGFDAATVEAIRRMAQEPYGMLLVAGPTGSGKTTTLYASICEINNGRDKIITIEDPVEYVLPGVLQIPVNEKKGLTFARGLRSILRHDPDKIMVGEIRDGETAQISVQAALTGHLVFSTVHANSVFDVVGRFMHMGVDVYGFVSALNGMVAQRLVRVNCPHCSIGMLPGNAELIASGLTPSAVEDWRWRMGVGCEHCRWTGFKGRRAIAEVLQLDDEMRELIIARAPVTRLKEAARRQRAPDLRHSALALVQAGETTLEEINRVTLVG